MLRGILTVGGWTMASRVLGFARDMLIAARLGAGPVADAFFVALQLPNLFRRLFGEGAFNAAFVPAFAGTLARDDLAAAQELAQLLAAHRVPSSSSASPSKPRRRRELTVPRGSSSARAISPGDSSSR